MSDYLLFNLYAIRYAVDARTVREIFWLPELSMIEEAPPYIIGVINLRGKIIPIMSLEIRLQHVQKPISLSDRVIILETNDFTLGILVTDVQDVITVSASEIEPLPRFNQQPDTSIHFISGEAKVNDSLWMMLDLDTLINAPDLTYKTAEEWVSLDLFGHFPPEESKIFQARTKQLALNFEHQDAVTKEAFVVLQLSTELYAIAANEVREFCRFGQVTPIPCCPPRFIGNMNLRGDILTLIDLCSVLSLTVIEEMTEIMVIESDDLQVGIPVTKVMDVIYVSTSEYLPLPNHIDEIHQAYCSSAIAYKDCIASVLDIKTLLTKGGLEVNETV